MNRWPLGRQRTSCVGALFFLIMAATPASAADVDKDALANSLSKLVTCQTHYSVLALAHIKQDKTKTQEFTRVVSNGQTINEIIKFMAETTLDQKGVGGLNAFMKEDMKIAVDKYKPNDHGAFDRLYTDEMKKRDESCESLIIKMADALKTRRQ